MIRSAEVCHIRRSGGVVYSTLVIDRVDGIQLNRAAMIGYWAMTDCHPDRATVAQVRRAGIVLSVRFPGVLILGSQALLWLKINLSCPTKPG